MGNVLVGPTKEFFIDMITRDIQLEKSILDLIDNSIDGAKKSGRIDDKVIKLIINEDKFEILDNCGGFSKKIAEEYAFKFGRSSNSDREVIGHSIGRFGVGMKRTLFKLGNRFVVESKSSIDEHFRIDIDVNEWKSRPDDWNLKLEEKHDESVNDWMGTKIIVTELYGDIKEAFKRSNFANSSLKLEIGYSYAKLIKDGLSIYLNSEKVDASELDFIYDDDITPGIRNFNLNGVNVIVIAGLSEAIPEKCGWYIYANDRLLLMADRTKVTGWGNKSLDIYLPKYHATYAMFRGVVFMDCVDVTKLPLTTTKVGVDVDSEIYKNILYNMSSMMKEVFSSLKKIDSKEVRSEINRDHSKVTAFVLQNEYCYELKQKFKFMIDIESMDESESRINFKRPKDIIEKVKSEYDLSTNREVGEHVFDYFVDMECL